MNANEAMKNVREKFPELKPSEQIIIYTMLEKYYLQGFQHASDYAIKEIKGINK